MIERHVTFSAASLVESGERCYAFQQGGFSHAILTGD